MRLIRVLAVVAFVSAACGGGNSDERRILIDFSHDEFATFVLQNSPGKVTVTQGQTIVFKQTWTGEPHTVTGGSAVTGDLTKATTWIDMFNAFGELASAGSIPDPESEPDKTWADFAGAVKAAPKGPREAFTKAWNALRADGVALPDLNQPDATPLGKVNDIVNEASEPAFENIRFAMDDDGNIAQNLGQPCYLRTGAPPEDTNKACDKADQKQPVFDGKQSFYNSGILPYEGAQGNTYKIKLADDIAPGEYIFYCAIHGPQQLSKIEVKKRGTSIPSQAEVSRAARDGLDDVLKPLEKVYRQAVSKGEVTMDGEPVKGPFAGLFAPGIDHAGINEFIPKTMRVKANEPIVWKMMGSDHSITFDVPAYFPIVDFSSPGGIRFNPKLSAPAGGAPEKPEQEGEGVVKMDGGTYSGKGFWSSGLIGAEPYLEYTLRIAKPGTYDYACLLHPPMVGKIVVT